MSTAINNSIIYLYLYNIGTTKMNADERDVNRQKNTVPSIKH